MEDLLLLVKKVDWDDVQGNLTECEGQTYQCSLKVIARRKVKLQKYR